MYMSFVSIITFNIHVVVEEPQSSAMLEKWVTEMSHLESVRGIKSKMVINQPHCSWRFVNFEPVIGCKFWKLGKCLLPKISHLLFV